MSDRLHFVQGDATQPMGDGPWLLAHGVNTAGVWGAGFVLAVSKRMPEAEMAYQGLFLGRQMPQLGDVQFVGSGRVPGLLVANMFTQTLGGKRPFSYPGFRKCLSALQTAAKFYGASVHAPRVGCGLAGEVWADIEPVILEELCDLGVETYIYDFVPK